jgi:YbbR domain-containing protein
MAFIFAVIVWVSAVTSGDPNREATFEVPIEVIGLASDLEIISDVPASLSLTLVAPRSILDNISEELNTLRAWVDLSDLGAGTHTVPVQYRLPAKFQPLRIVDSQPATAEITLEKLISKTMPIQTDVRGKPPLGYQAGTPTWSHDQVTVSGRASLVERVTEVKATLSITGAEDTLEQNVSLTAYDENGFVVSGVTLEPSNISVVQPINLKGGYRNMVVKVVTTGQVAEGYRQTSISVSPPNVMLFSADPTKIDDLPGFVETEPLDLSGAVDDIETSLSLNLPEGVSVIGDPNVLVQVGVAAMEGNLTVVRSVEAIGTLPQYEAKVAPENVEVILYGPIPVLDSLTETDVRVVVDVEDLEEGSHQLTPEVVVLPERVEVESVSPNTIEVEIVDADATATPTTEP